MVEYANEKGLVVMMTGVADPADRGGCRVSQSYPRTADSVIFARNLAARLAGNHVIFSVNFDDWPGTVLDASAPTAGTVDSTTLAVGPVLKGAVPRHLIVNHLAGSSQLANYTNYQSLPWLDFQLFQSGHSAKVSVACPTKAGSTWQAKQQCAVSRAIDLTKGLRAASPLKPAVNGEGAYEDPNSGAVPPDNRYGMRHTSYASLLGGATGFTAGVNGIPPYGSLPLWSQPETLFGAHTTDGIKDMQATRALLDGIFPGSTTSWGEFVPTTPAFVDASTSTAQDDTVAGERRILTGTKDDVVLSYLPNSPTVNVIGGLNFKCVSWTAEWRDPRGVRPAAHLCPGNTRTQFSIPLGCPNRSQGDQFGSCDWIMFMRRPKNAGSGLTAVGPNETYVQVATVDPTDPVDQSGGSTTGELMAQEVTAEGIPLSSQTSIGLEDTAQNGQPIVSKIAADSQPETYWTVWEAEAGEDGTTDVFGRLVGGDGAPIGDVFQINQYLPGSQFDPFTLIDAAGNVTVIWTSLGQDGDQGGIFARRFQLSGSPGGDEFQVNVTSVGDQESARGGVDDSGDFVIAWRSGDGEIKVRMFSGTGSSRSGEIAVNSTSQGREELIDLEVDPSGEFSVHWEEYSSDDQLLGRYVRDFDADGNPLGDQVADAPQ